MTTDNVCRACGGRAGWRVGAVAPRPQFNGSPVTCDRCADGWPAVSARHAAPVHGPGTFNGARMGAPRPVKREDPDGSGITIHTHNLAGAEVRTHRTYRVSPAGWVYAVTFGTWHTMGYARTQRESLEVAAGQLCRAVDSGQVIEP
jgi:hypothetical protein